MLYLKTDKESKHKIKHYLVESGLTLKDFMHKALEEKMCKNRIGIIYTSICPKTEAIMCRASEEFAKGVKLAAIDSDATLQNYIYSAMFEKQERDKYLWHSRKEKEYRRTAIIGELLDAASSLEADEAVSLYMEIMDLKHSLEDEHFVYLNDDEIADFSRLGSTLANRTKDLNQRIRKQQRTGLIKNNGGNIDENFIQ